MEACCREVLGKSVVEQCWEEEWRRAVLWKRAAEKCWGRVV